MNVLIRICAFFFILLAGCTPAQQVKVQQDIEKVVAPIQATTLADAQAALAIAIANNDTDGVQCFTDIVNYLGNPINPLPAVNGVLSALEAARTFKGISIPANIHSHCAVIVLDAPTTALKLGLPLK
jgi:hypothetical protein